MEEYLDGPEVDVDLVFCEGQPVYGAVNDNWPTLEPYFNETGSNGPSVLPLWQQRELAGMAVGSTQALGFVSVSELAAAGLPCYCCAVEAAAPLVMVCIAEHSPPWQLRH